MKIKQIFDEIASESSTNKKVEILSQYKDNDLLKRVLYLADSPRIKFYIKQIPTYECGAFDQGLEVALDTLTALSSRSLTGHAAINHLKATLEFCNQDDAYIIERIIEKDCKMNLGTTLINKVFPKLIEETAYMGAKAFEEKLARKIFADGPAYSQIKMDGRYCNARINHGKVELESRQGEPTLLDDAKFLRELASLEYNMILNGELTMKNISRYKSNGIIASLISIKKKSLEGDDVTTEIADFESEHMPYQEALDSIVFTIWDMITPEQYKAKKSATPYNIRFDCVIEMLQYVPVKFTNLTFVETNIVSTYEEAIEHFQLALARGEEGTILKSGKGGWKDGKPNFQVKMKLEIDVDLTIVGFNYGTGKNANVISSVNAQSSDGLVNTRPTGINEKMMKFITQNQDKLLNTILEVKCSGLSKDEKGNYSLLHPVFKMLRTDEKTTSDSLPTIIGIEAMAKMLK